MIDDTTANLSIDFLAGFTIFMIAFIYIATLIPGLLLGLQSHTIDYDAVAYRTGVIMVEDPGYPESWENPGEYYDNTLQTNDVRFGLALSKDTPNVLSTQKVTRFFCQTLFVYPGDYRTRAVFGDYPYLFNISLKFFGDTDPKSIGAVRPDGYGYSRRVVQLREWSNASINESAVLAMKFNTTQNVTTHHFTISLNTTDLLDNPANANSTSPIYQIDPWQDQIMVNLSDMNKFYDSNYSHTTAANLSAITILRAQQSQPFPNPSAVPVRNFSSGIPLLTAVPPLYLYTEGSSTPVQTLPAPVNNSLCLKFPSGFFYNIGANNVSQEDTTTKLYVRLTFTLDNPANPLGDWYLNNTGLGDTKGPFEYNYSTRYITQPSLRPGVMEISVW